MTNRKVLVDSHVHLYPVFDRNVFLSSAFDHARSAGAAYPWLLFTETSKDFAFRDLAGHAPEGWTSTTLGDGSTIRLASQDGRQVLVTAGRQIQTSEGLELLALGSDDLINDGTSLADALKRVLKAGALPVIPWGFGKWTGRRGRILADLIGTSEGRSIFLGDNGGRPWFWPEPPPFRTVVAAGRRILPGSDPLPFKSHERRAGSYGLVVELAADDHRPFAGLADMLMAHNNSYPTVGSLAGSFPFVRDQVAMQIVKRTR